MDILVTASGKSSRFGGQDKYLIDVLGAPMLQWALRSIKGIRGRKIYIALSSDENRAKVEKICRDFGVDVEILVVGETTGQAHTVKLALDQMEKASSFIVVPVDTVLTVPLNLSAMRGNSILTFESTDYKSFSFVALSGGKVTAIKEKQEGDLATAGYYSFASKERFLQVWEEIDHSKEEYVSHIYQKMIEGGEKVTSKEVSAKTVVDLGTPQKLQDNLEKIFELIVAPLRKSVNPDLDTIKKALKDNSDHPHNVEVLDYVEKYAERPLSDEFGYGALAHTYNRGAKALNQLLKEDDLSWLTFFIYDSVDTPYSLWRYLERSKGANIAVIEDSDEIKYKVPHKRQFILDYFKAQGKKRVLLFDDDFSWRIAYKCKDYKTPASMKINFAQALRILTWIAIEQDHDYLCTGTNIRRIQYLRSNPVMMKRGAIYWNVFILNLEALERDGISFVTDRPIHEDLAISLDIAKKSESAYVFFMIQQASYDFNQNALISREEETEAYGGVLWKTKTKVQGGEETKFFSVNLKELARLKKRQKTLFDGDA